MKSGLLEIADIIAINKADRGGAERMEHDLSTAFELVHLRDDLVYRKPLGAEPSGAT